MAKTFYDIFSELNKIPRASHHEERIADYLCSFAEQRGLKYRRDKENCVVIEKPASPGCENSEPVVILNHMDMVCVAQDGYLRDGHKFDPLTDDIRPYIEKDDNGTRWMKAEGTSLGADNGIGLSMALAILDDDSIIHPALEVLTTTNEEDGMSGAEALSNDFIRGRKVINLDSEAYDEITTGAAGAYIQVGKWELQYDNVPENYIFFRLVIDGGLGGHSGVDINKGRCNCNQQLSKCLYELISEEGILVCSMSGGTANASIASCAEAVIALVPSNAEKIKGIIQKWNDDIAVAFHDTDSSVSIRLEPAKPGNKHITNACQICKCIMTLPFGAISMRDDMPGTVMTSNNIGVVNISENLLTVSCHTRSFSNDIMHSTALEIKSCMKAHNASIVDTLMDTGAWMEREDSPLLSLTCQTFKEVLGFEPKKVAMHFVLEAAYYTEKYPGIEMASIGPLIIEPHSTSERVNLDTADNIWKVTLEMLRRMAQ